MADTLGSGTSDKKLIHGRDHPAPPPDKFHLPPLSLSISDVSCESPNSNKQTGLIHDGQGHQHLLSSTVSHPPTPLSFFLKQVYAPPKALPLPVVKRCSGKTHYGQPAPASSGPPSQASCTATPAVCFGTSTPEQKPLGTSQWSGSSRHAEMCQKNIQMDGRIRGFWFFFFCLLTVFFMVRGLFLRRSSFGVTRSVTRSQRMEMRSQTDALQIRRARYFLFCWMSAA